MPDPQSTTQDHPGRDAPAEASPYRDSFDPGRRVIAGPSEVDELRHLLQERLRAASVVLAVGFGQFVLRAMFLNRLESLNVLFYGLILGLLLLSLALLSSSWRPTLRELRIHEVSLFAGVTLFFMASQYIRRTG